MRELVFAGLLLFGAIVAAENDFDGFLNLQEKLYQAEKQRFDNLERQVSSLTGQMVSLINSNHQLQQENERLRIQIAELQTTTHNNFTRTNANVEVLKENVNAVETTAQNADSKASQALEQTKNSITNVRFGPSEQGNIWKGPGFLDTPGYLITGVVNRNVDEYLDHANRRRFEYEQNGNWHAVSW